MSDMSRALLFLVVWPCHGVRLLRHVVLVVVTVRRRRGFPFRSIRTCSLVVNRHLGKKTKKNKKNVPIETHLPLTPSLPSPSIRAAAGVSWRDVVVEWGVWGS
jgi:hypothetical protein